MNKVSTLAAAALTVALLAAACSTSDSAGEAGSSTPTTAAESTVTLAPDEQVESTTTTVADADSAEPFLNPDGYIQEISVSSAASGNGTRPLLEWETVPGAFMYSLYVLAPGGELYWAWEGTDAAVHFGGEPQLEESAAGPSVVPGMTWSVAAYDEEFHVIGLSEMVEISP